MKYVFRFGRYGGFLFLVFCLFTTTNSLRAQFTQYKEADADAVILNGPIFNKSIHITDDSVRASLRITPSLSIGLQNHIGGQIVDNSHPGFRWGYQNIAMGLGVEFQPTKNIALSIDGQYSRVGEESYWGVAPDIGLEMRFPWYAVRFDLALEYQSLSYKVFYDETKYLIIIGLPVFDGQSFGHQTGQADNLIRCIGATFNTTWKTTVINLFVALEISGTESFKFETPDGEAVEQSRTMFVATPGVTIRTSNMSTLILGFRYFQVRDPIQASCLFPTTQLVLHL